MDRNNTLNILKSIHKTCRNKLNSAGYLPDALKTPNKACFKLLINISKQDIHHKKYSYG